MYSSRLSFSFKTFPSGKEIFDNNFLINPRSIMFCITVGEREECTVNLHPHFKYTSLTSGFLVGRNNGEDFLSSGKKYLCRQVGYRKTPMKNQNSSV